MQWINIFRFLFVRKTTFPDAGGRRFSITGRGTVATGRIESGVINTGDAVEIIGLQEQSLKSTVTGVEMFRKILDEGEAGDNVGLLLRGIEKDDIRRGMVVCAPGSITPHTEFKCEVYVLEKRRRWSSYSFLQ